MKDDTDQPIADVLITTDWGHREMTDASGAYAITNLIAGTYTITPTLAGWEFTPASQTVSVPPDATDIAFIGSPPPPPLEITEIEINQVLGRQASPPRYVAGKHTVVRAFLTEEVEVDPETQWLQIERDDQPVATLHPIPSRSPTDVLTFECPALDQCGHWEEGLYEFDATVNGVSAHESATFETTRDLRILAIPIRTAYGLPDSSWKVAGNFLRQVYPLAFDGIEWVLGPEVDATNYNLDAQGTCEEMERWLGQCTGRTALLAVLNTRARLESWSWLGLREYDHIVGFIPAMPVDCNLDGGECGCKGGWRYTGTNVSVVMTNGSFLPWCSTDEKVNQSMEAKVAHEIGHVYGLGDEYNYPQALSCSQPNLPPTDYLDCGPTVPAWTGDEERGTGSLVAASVYHPFELIPLPFSREGPRGAMSEEMLSFMGNGKYQEDIWVTADIYQHLFNELDFSPEAEDAPASPEKVILASGWISKDHTVVLDPWYHLTATIGTPVTGTYTIEAVDALSQTLASTGFDVSFGLQSDPPEETTMAPFGAVVGFPPDTEAFRIKLGETVLRVVPISAGKPIVTVSTPSSGELVSGTYAITWDASDPDGDHLYHTVEYTHNDEDWLVLAGAITGTELIANFMDLAGSDTARVRITTSDGVNTAQATSEPFRVLPTAPEVLIQTPTDGASSPLGMRLALYGVAYDPQDGSLRSTASLVWSSDQDGILGGGELLNLTNLSAGEHKITLSATNSLGLTSSASVTVFIGERVYLPLVLRE